MIISLTTFTISDYCLAMERSELVVNRDYQRSDKVWPHTARSFLIETILLGYPLPKLSLYQITDLKSRKTVKEIVDGQQRSMAIREYFEDKYRLSTTLVTEDIRGKSYSELDESFQQKFVEYQLSVDLFLAATPEDVREVFRRMNSFTVPLNGEEQRHAAYQGKVKWFIHRLGRRYDKVLQSMGVFNQRQLYRMRDTKLLAEITHAILFGIQTTDKKKLDALYRDRNEEFPEEARIERDISTALDAIAGWEEIRQSSLMKPYEMYALVLAVIHVRSSLVPLNELFESPGTKELDRERAIAGLTALSDALENPDAAGALQAFVNASSDKTNVKEQRERRFIWMCRALIGELG